MIVTLIGVLLCILSGCLFFYSNNKIVKINLEEVYQNSIVKKQKELATKQVEELDKRLVDLQEQEKIKTSNLFELQKKIDENLQFHQKNSSEAFSVYFKTLEEEYQKADNEFNQLQANLEDAYSKKQLTIISNLEKEKKELEKIRATRQAAIEAWRKEQEVKDKMSFYSLQLTEEEKSDIQILENVKTKLAKPRVLSMLIWSTFYQKQMNALCNNILGLSTVCGVYKITNQNNSMCYIGQAVDIATRWKTHAKCGLGIDTPAANKLYKAMQEEGINSFSWEVLEVCPQEELNNKEKYYIELYQSYHYGYNSSRGITTA